MKRFSSKSASQSASQSLSRVVALLFLLVGAISITAQPRNSMDKTVFLDYGDRFHADAYVVPMVNPDSARIAVFFRMANDFLTFTKVADPNEVKGNYRADMVVGIEVRDTLGVIRKRVRWEGVAYCNTFEETNSKRDFHYGWQAIDVGPGSYSIALEILNRKESDQKKITLQKVSFLPKRATRLLTAPMFVEPTIKGGVELLRPYVYSSNLTFGSRDARALILIADKQPTEYDYVIEQRPWEARDIRWWRVSDVRGVVRSSTKKFPKVSELASTNAPMLEMVEDGVQQRPLATLEIPVPVTALVPGTYDIFLISKEGGDTVKSSFKILWEMMPLSLRNLDYAYRAMQHLISEDQLDSLNDGSDGERRERLMQWWRAQDPTPTTTYNERMAEYFNRVDEAFYAYSTIQEPDGAMSDRGKVYILYGQPSNIEKKLAPGQEPLEVWTYANRVNKVITFRTTDKGLFKIKTVEPATKP